MSERSEMEAKVKVGARVRVRADWSRIAGGVVQEVAHTGFRICGMWFGWHELVEIESEAK